jgi:UDP-N-acetyl-D-mannosaminuronate dehydrogenase
LVAVPTNIDGDAINTTHLHIVRDMLREVVGENDIVVVESSIHVGGTRELFQEFLDRGVGWNEFGKSFSWYDRGV